MSEIEIRGGGAVAVDTDTLRHTAVRFLGAHLELEEVSELLGSLQLMLWNEGGAAWEAERAAWDLVQRLRDAMDEATGIAERLRAAAAVYELVELNAARGVALLAGDTAELERIDALRQAIRSEHPDAAAEAWSAMLERAVMWPSELVRQSTEFGLQAGSEVGVRGGIVGGAATGAIALAFGALTGLSGQGRLARGSRLGGTASPFALSATAPTAAAVPPATLAAAASRIPSGGDARVRVEKYTMPDGSRQFAVYVAGTHTKAADGDGAWDMASNVELYGGATSASYAATAEALSAAGAERGDTVHAFGHSQGAMITSHLALDGEYDVRTLVTLGSPVEADVGPGTLSIGIRHTDDPVAVLAGGGHVGPVGAPGSFVVETSFDPATGPHDARMPAHRLTAYAETAALVDASADPRVAALRSVFGELGSATAVEASEFAATRTGPGAVSPSAAVAG